MDDNLPIIDMRRLSSTAKEDRVEVARLLGRACRETGFFYLIGHGIPARTFSALFNDARRLFALQPAELQALSIGQNRNNRGYFGLAQERLDPLSVPDRKEGFNIGLELDPADPEFDRPFRGANSWPSLPGWRNSMLSYFEHCLAIGQTLHRGFCLDLGLREDFFAQALDRPAATLRLLRYPPKSGLISDAPGAGEHTDYGNVTLLAVDGVAGLELRRRDGAWIDAPVVLDALIVNIGDCLMRWTNDIYTSTPHRVRVPEQERLSIAFFLDPNPESVVVPVTGGSDALRRYPPITGGDYLRSRLDPSYEPVALASPTGRTSPIRPGQEARHRTAGSH